jgi:hypothetical protein
LWLLLAGQVVIMPSRAFSLGVLLLVWGAASQSPDEGYAREQLQPLTKFRCSRAHPAIMLSIGVQLLA